VAIKLVQITSELTFS